MKRRHKKRSAKNTVGQLIYLTASFYARNNLYTCAASCAFGFLFSFIPIVMTVLAVLVRIIHASPEIIDSVLSRVSEYKTMFDAESFIDGILKVKTFGRIEFVLVLFIVLMARKSFAAVMQGMRRIFHKKIKTRAIFNHALIVIGELALIVIATLIILLLFALRNLFTLFPFAALPVELPPLLVLSPVVITVSEFALIFVIVLLAYRYASETKPNVKLCAFCSSLCTLSFFTAAKLTNEFLNMANYNIIYGVLGGLMVFLFQTYIFFTLFFIFAQVVYIVQFFDPLVLSELYLLPDRDDTKLNSIVKRILFITPSAIMNDDNVENYTAGSIIYAKNERSDDSYYVVSGAVLINRNGNLSYCDTGSFFGEETCILDQLRTSEAKAETDCKLMKISAEEFRSLLEINHKTAEKALSHISEYVSRVYGRTETFLL
ncbi:virulence factor BrkB [Treponema socranskii subsp. socranskii VPI DR56BR1116 = ATCC 35536]|uniref:Virulence factor BrkB n=1 Tax=Treponema socranskii subsp. socranskii VPI DR56BR1116 = ATCC 35536 TaxID=1125725 RepID=U1FJJ9_TRESO|nr:YhjD/YihY/BrkB family envelope integrity protein [Treponema socranskii]ERF59521.1 virulence factor BrkB [Treponema socranskii subsp. socranskii VPI DR56BR1116 = ATCC 35536]ERK01305.1 virulence factor BrkB [Treponema socranskii subsp. socranskii VPI DR56BR1116 = ATCC 35536]